MRKVNRKIKGNLLLLLTAIIWGTSFIATKSGAENMGPFAFNCVRSLIGGIALLPVILMLGHRNLGVSDHQNRKDLIIGGILCGLALFSAGAFQQIGILYTSAGKTGFITSLYVVLVPVLQIFLKKKMRMEVWFCVIAAMVGFSLLSMPKLGQISMGDFLIFIGAFCFALHILVIDYYVGRVDSVQMSCIQFFSCSAAATIGMLIIDPLLGFDPLNVDCLIGSAIPLLYSGIFSCSIAYTLQIVGQKITDSIFASLILSLESVFAVISGMLIFGERMVAREWIGCIVIFAAVVVAQFFSEEKNIQKCDE